MNAACPECLVLCDEQGRCFNCLKFPAWMPARAARFVNRHLGPALGLAAFLVFLLFLWAATP